MTDFTTYLRTIRELDITVVALHTPTGYVDLRDESDDD